MSAQIRIQIDTQANDGAQQVARDLDEIDRKARNAGNGFTVMGGAVATALGGVALQAVSAMGSAMVGFVASSFSAAADFEAQMSGIQAVLAPTGQEMEALRQKALDLGASTSFSASEAAEGIEMLAKNGLDATKILGGAADATIALAAAAGTDLSTAADIATDVMAQFGLEASELMTAVNGIVGVTTASKFTIDDYALALAQAGGVASSVGVELDDFNTTIAAISPLFKSGSDAGTSFKTFLQSLIPKSNAAKAALEDVGLMQFNVKEAMDFLAQNGIVPLTDSVVDVEDAMLNYMETTGMTQKEQEKMWSSFQTTKFYDQYTGELKNMEEVTKLFEEATRDMTEEQMNNFATTVFGTDANRVLFGLLKTGSERFAELRGQIQATDAALAAQTRLDNFKGAWEQVQGAIETLQITIGSLFLPVLTDLFNNVISPGINVITNLVGALTGSREAFDNLPGPIQAFLAPLLGLESALTSASESVRTMTAPLLDWQVILDALPAPIAAIIEKIVEIVGAIRDNWQPVLMAIAGIITAMILPTLAAMIAAVLPVIAVIGAAIAIGLALYEAWQSNFGGIRDIVATIMEAVQSIIQSVASGILSFWRENGDSILAFAKTTWETVQRIISTVATIVASIISSVFGAIASFISTHGSTIQSILTTAWNQIQNVVTTVLGVIEGIVNTVLAAIQGDWDGVMNGLKSIATTVWDGIKATIENAVNAGKAVIQLLIDIISEPLRSALADAAGFFGPFEGAIEGIKSAIRSVLGIIQSLINKFNELRNAIPDSLIPGSPTPFELGLRGISSAMKLLTGDVGRLSVAMPGIAPGAGGTANTYHNRTVNYTAHFNGISGSGVSDAIARSLAGV